MSEETLPPDAVTLPPDAVTLPPDAVTIKVREDGPLKVTGPILLTDHNGTQIACEGNTVALCRCGDSSNKPFCDGSHRGSFDGTIAAVAGDR